MAKSPKKDRQTPSLDQVLPLDTWPKLLSCKLTAGQWLALTSAEPKIGPDCPAAEKGKLPPSCAGISGIFHARNCCVPHIVLKHDVHILSNLACCLNDEMHAVLNA